MKQPAKKNASTLSAFCWASGVIQFAKRKPKGALLLMRGPARKVRQTITATARHGYDGKTLLVPGVPEASMLRRDPVKAVIDFCEWINTRSKRALSRHAKA